MPSSQIEAPPVQLLHLKFEVFELTFCVLKYFELTFLLYNPREADPVAVGSQTLGI